MNEPIAVSIIIVNYNTTRFLRNCLNSINGIKERDKTEIIVVDNNSSERTIENFVHEYPDVNFFLRDTNNGFAAGCNFGAENAKGRYLLFLNPDIRFRDNSINVLLNYFEANSNTGIISGVMYDESEKIIYFYNDFPSLSWELSLMYSPLIISKINKLNSIMEIKENVNFEVDWFHGAFLMIKKEDFLSVDMFNEEYFIYYEDVELCYKVKNQLLKKNICIPEFRYYHSTKSSLSSQVNDDLYTFHMYRGKLLFIRNYSTVKRMVICAAGLVNISSRLIILPFWKKYKGFKMQKFRQMLKIIKLFFSNSYLQSSKFEFIQN